MWPKNVSKNIFENISKIKYTESVYFILDIFSDIFLDTFLARYFVPLH